MKSFFQRIPLPVKLFLIGFIPLVIVIFLSIELYTEKTKKANLLKSYIDRIHQSGDITHLIDLLRTERNYSYDYALKKEGRSRVNEQRARTDSSIQKLIAPGSGFSDFTNYTFLNDLSNVRAKIDSSKYPAGQVVHYYTTIIFRLNTLNPIPIGVETYLPEVYDDLVSQKLLSEMVTYLGITCTNVYTALYTRSYMIETLVGTLGTYQVYNSYEKEFLVKGTPSVTRDYKELQSKDPLKSTMEYLDKLFKTFKFDSTYNAMEWRRMSGSAVEEIRQLQQNLLNKVELSVNSFYNNGINARNRAIILLVVIIGFVIAFVAYTIYIINLALLHLKKEAEKISAGGSGVHLNGVSNDVIGSLAQSILKIDENNKALAKTADAIGRGNFDMVVKPRSKDDVLGTAIATMKRGLQQFTNDLEESEMRNRQLLQALPAAIYTCDANGFIKMYNKSAVELWGLEPTPGFDHIKAGWKMYRSDGKPLGINEYPMMKVLRDEPYSDEEVVIQRPDGSKCFVVPHLQAIYDSSGAITGTINMLIDITERKYVEKEIANLAAIVQYTEDAIISKTPEGIVTSWNPGAEKLFGYTAEEMIGEPILKLIPPDRLNEEPEILSRIKRGERVQHFNTIRRTKSGKLIDISLTISPIRDKRGNIIGASKIARDITETVQVRKKIEESEERLRMAITSTNLGTWDYRPLTGELSWSEECKKIYAFPPGEKIDLQVFSDHIYPEDKEYAQSEILKAMDPDGEGNYDITYRILRFDDKSLRWIRAQGKVFFNTQRQAERFIGTVVDITEQKQAHEALEESEERFKIIANTAPVMIWMSGQDKFSDFFNISWLNFTGRTMAEESGDGWLEGVYPGDLERCIAMYNESFKAQKAFYIEYRLRRYDGTYRWISDSAVPRVTPEGMFIGFISACRDIDDEKHYNEKLKESELLFKTITNVSPVGLWMTDKKGKNNFVNDTWIEWTGISLDNQFDRGWMEVVLPAEKDYVNKKFEQSFISRTNFSAEFRIRRKDEKIRWILSEGSPYFDIDGYFAGYAGSVIDITERKEDEMRKNEFLAVASHELKTPLTSIKAYAQLLAKTYEKSNDGFLNNALSKVELQVNKMTKLVSDFLNLSKIESDKLQLNTETFVINDLVDEIAADIQLVSVNHTIVVEKGETLKVEADREKVSQVITNFLNNAVKYSPQGMNITVSVVNDEGNAKVLVTDKGIGVNPEEHEKIFQRFYRSKFNDNISFSGFGIGLYISAEIIRRHNGQIGVISEEGKGATFYFSLPAAR